MVLKRIEKKAHGAFLNYYTLIYRNRIGNQKIYEMISRDSNIKKGEDLSNRNPQAVILVIFDKEHKHILLNKEYRMAVNEIVYNMPAGLIEQGETYEEAGRRELKEETGLDLIRVIKVLPPSYSAVGISNEKTVCIICEAEGSIGGTPEPDEEIEPIWMSKEEIVKILNDIEQKESLPMAARTQMLCYMWVNNL